MGTQTMGSQGGVGDSTRPKPSTLCRQGSLYNLTLDEVQGSLGKPLNSMNMDELLKNVWNVDTNQSLDIGGGNDGGENVGNEASGSNLNRQSSFSLSRDLSKKTVDEVWKEILQGKKGSGSGSQERDPERQNTLGEMTLEDFLVHAGVELDAPDGNGNRNDNSGQSGWVGVEPNVGQDLNVSQSAQWMQYQLLPQQQQQQQSMMSVFMPAHHVPQTISVGGAGGTISDSGFSEAQLGVSASPLMGTLSEAQPASRKRGAPGIMIERTVERRQKRMIKNRESAARSRARKQAYTNELENKVSQLEAENERLRKMREVEKALPSVPPPQPKYQLRRTSSAPF